VNCLGVRDLLTEHALGLLSRSDAASVDRHLEWCAACRKEAGELQRAAATMAFTVATADPSADLEDRVVDAVRSAAGRRAAASPRRSRVAAAAVLAATLALSGLGWGAVMAGRNARLQDQVDRALADQQNAFQDFAERLRQIEGADPANVVELADLMSPRQWVGGGDALVLLSPSTSDVVLVAFTGLVGVGDRRLPLEVWIESDEAADKLIGRIRQLDTGGGGGVSEWYLEDLTAFDAVVVRDARGRVLLQGTLTVYQPPTP
jgi:Putative zinc-finger